jgi:flagellar protein FliO/FliZ
MDFTELFRFAAALAFIIGLIGVCAWGARKLGLATGGFSGAGALKRLSISEVKIVDAKHRLILIRRDDKEHLVLLGGEQNLLIETGIDAPAVEAAPAAAATAATPAPVLHIQRIVEFIKERRA